MNVWLTFHDVDQGAHVTLLDDAAVLAVLHWIHAVHDLLDLRLLQVLHEVIVLDGLLDEILGPGGKVKGNAMQGVRQYWSFWVVLPWKGKRVKICTKKHTTEPRWGSILFNVH